MAQILVVLPFIFLGLITLILIKENRRLKNRLDQKEKSIETLESLNLEQINLTLSLFEFIDLKANPVLINTKISVQKVKEIYFERLFEKRQR